MGVTLGGGGGGGLSLLVKHLNMNDLKLDEMKIRVRWTWSYKYYQSVYGLGQTQYVSHLILMTVQAPKTAVKSKKTWHLGMLHQENFSMKSIGKKQLRETQNLTDMRHTSQISTWKIGGCSLVRCPTMMNCEHYLFYKKMWVEVILTYRGFF